MGKSGEGIRLVNGILPSRLVEIGAVCLAKNSNSGLLTNSSTDWLQANVGNDWYIAEGYITLSQSWKNFKYLTFVCANRGDGYRGMSITTLDIDAIKAQKQYIDDHSVGATLTNTVANAYVVELSYTLGETISTTYTYVHLFRSNYGNRYPGITSDTIIHISNAYYTPFYIYGHNTL